MPLIKNQTAATTANGATSTIATTINEIDKTATTQSAKTTATHKSKHKVKNTANNEITTTTNETAKTTNTTTTTSSNNKNNSKRQQQQPNDIRTTTLITTTAATKRKKHFSNNKHRKHKTSLAKSVPATPVQVNPLTTNHFVPSSPDFYDDNYDDDDDDILYMPPYSYPNCSLDMLNGDIADYNFDNVYHFNNGHQQPGAGEEEEEHFREALGDNHPLDLQRDMDEDSSSMAMITPPPPYDTPYSKHQTPLYTYSSSQRYQPPQHQAAYTAPKSQRSHNGSSAHTRKYIFNNNREQFNISSSNGNSSSNSIQQQPQSSSLGSTLTNAITPTKLSAAAAAMFAAPQMVQLNRKWSNLHRKRRRRNSSSGDSKELDKLVLQSVDWDENDIY